MGMLTPRYEELQSRREELKTTVSDPFAANPAGCATPGPLPGRKPRSVMEEIRQDTFLH